MTRCVAIVLAWLLLMAWTMFGPLWALNDAFGSPTSELAPVQVERRILTAFGSDRGPRAVRIARCESRTSRRQLDPRAVGAAGERGLFQIHPIHFDQPARRGSKLIIRSARLFDVDYNVRVAFEMSGGGRNWGPWSCSRLVP